MGESGGRCCEGDCFCADGNVVVIMMDDDVYNVVSSDGDDIADYSGNAASNGYGLWNLMEEVVFVLEEEYL